MLDKKTKEKAIFEKRKHLRITTLCNNNCIFCLAGGIKDRRHLTLEEVTKQIKQGIEENCERLILSGGDATIHPKFLEIIKLGKDTGYKKIQVITNGRMFSYGSFLIKSIQNGLDEITFSIHSHIPEIQDKLTIIKGSFKQSISALKKAITLKDQGKLIVSVDIVLNALNVESIKDTFEFFYNLGVMEIDLLQITPFGNARTNKDVMFYDIDKNMDNIKLEGRTIEPVYGRNIDTAPALLARYEKGEGVILSEGDIRLLGVRNFKNAPELANNYWDTSTLFATKGKDVKVILPYRAKSRNLTKTARILLRSFNFNNPLTFNKVNLKTESDWERLKGKEVYEGKIAQWFEKGENGELIGLNEIGRAHV